MYRIFYISNTKKSTLGSKESFLWLDNANSPTPKVKGPKKKKKKITYTDCEKKRTQKLISNKYRVFLTLKNMATVFLNVSYF